MKKPFLTRGLLFCGALCCACAAQAQADPDISEMYRQLLLLVWVPLLSTLLCGVLLKVVLLRRYWGQERNKALLFSGAATTVEFAITLALMRLLYEPMRHLRVQLAPLIGDFAGAALSGLVSTLVVFLLVWKLYMLALAKFIPAPVTTEEPGRRTLPAWVPPLLRDWRWDVKRMAAVMALLHPALLHFFTYAVFLLFFMGR